MVSRNRTVLKNNYNLAFMHGETSGCLLSLTPPSAGIRNRGDKKSSIQNLITIFNNDRKSIGQLQKQYNKDPIARAPICFITVGGV